MTLEEAIKTLEEYIITPESVPLDDEANALKLGIEALKEIKRARDNGYRFVAVRLPGETEE